MSVGVFYSDEERALADGLGIRYEGVRSLDGWRVLGTALFAYSDDTEPWAEVLVEVNPMPARFWRFTVTPLKEDVHAVTLSTGSGSLLDYWPTVCLFAGGMMNVDVPAVPEP